MKTLLTSQVLSILPLHDATVRGICISFLPFGGQTVQLQIRLHDDESIEELASIGISTRNLNIVFENCWKIESDFLGWYSPEEVVSDLELIAESPLINSIRNLGFVSNDPLTHFKVIFSGGSVLHVVSPTTFVEEA